MPDLDREEIVRLIEEYGGARWINHIRRLLKLDETIGEDQEYDREIVWIAAHLRSSSF